MIGGRARQRRRTDGVAGGENSGNIGLEPLVHLHVPAAADGELQSIETDALQVGNAAECREHDVGGQHIAAAQLHLDLREAIEARAGNLDAAPILAAHGAQSAEKSRTQRGVEESQRLGHLDAGNVPRPRSGGEKNPRRAQHAARTVQALHLDAIRIQKDGAAADQFDLVARQLRLQIAVLGVDDDVDAVQQGR